MGEYQPGNYVYFGGNQRRFRILRLLPDRRLELDMGLDRINGGTKTRIVHIERDEVITVSPDLGSLRPTGFLPEFRSQGSYLR